MSTYVAGEHYNYKIHSQKKISSLKELKEQFILNIISYDKELFRFEIFNALEGTHNSLRSTIYSEVPAVAIKNIYLYNNTTCLEDSELFLRLELIPIDVDPDLLESYNSELPKNDEEGYQENACLIFGCDIKYVKSNITVEDIDYFIDPRGLIDKNEYIKKRNLKPQRYIYSQDIKLSPLPSQNPELFNVSIERNIPITVMMPGEEVVLKAVAVKGYGHHHAKYMPVDMAFSRMSNTMKLKDTITGESAKTLQQLYPKGVVEIVNGTAVVGNAKLMVRTNKNYLYHDDLKNKVEIGFDITHHFWEISSVRPVNQPSFKIWINALKIIIDKCNFYMENLNKLLQAISEANGGFVDCRSFGQTISGRFCYIERIEKNGFPFYKFHGEIRSFGYNLASMMDFRFGEKINFTHVPIDRTNASIGIEITVNTIKKNGINSDVALHEGLQALAEYNEFMMNYSIEKMSQFNK